jgi:hypothetical protein
LARKYIYLLDAQTLMSVCDTKEQFIEVFKKKYKKDYRHSMFGDMPIDMANTLNPIF